MTYGPGSQLWRTVCDIDFTSLTTQNLKAAGDGAKTIAGVTWTLVNSANATSVDITNGTGLVIVCNANNSIYTGGTRTAPILTLPLQTAMGFITPKEYKVPSHCVRIMSRVLLTNADANNENAIMGIEDATTPANQAFLIGKGFNGANNFTSVGIDTAVQTTVQQATASFTDDVLGLMYEAPDLCEYWSGVYDTAAGRLPYVFSSDRDSYSSNLATPLMRRKLEPNIFLGAETGNVLGTLTVTFTHFRVDVSSKTPPR